MDDWGSRRAMKRFCWYCDHEAVEDATFCKFDGHRVVVKDHLRGMVGR